MQTVSALLWFAVLLTNASGQCESTDQPLELGVVAPAIGTHPVWVVPPDRVSPSGFGKLLIIVARDAEIDLLSLSSAIEGSVKRPKFRFHDGIVGKAPVLHLSELPLIYPGGTDRLSEVNQSYQFVSGHLETPDSGNYILRFQWQDENSHSICFYISEMDDLDDQPGNSFR